MRVCNKCKLEKEDNKYYTYWHSTQQKYRTRRICNDCTRKQNSDWKRIRRENPNLKYENNPDYKQCATCKEWKLKNRDNFYYHSNKITPQRSCKVCKKIEEAIRREKDREKNMGGDDFRIHPNEYVNVYQRDAVFNIMYSIGWKFNEEKGVWWKEGIKKENGVFNFEDDLLVKKRIFIEGKINNKGRKYYSKMTNEMYNKMMEMKEKGISQNEIAKEVKLNPSTISKWIGQRRG